MTQRSSGPSLSKTLQLIQELQQQGLRVSLKGENLRITAEKGVRLSDEIKAELRLHKSSLVDLLRQNGAVVSQSAAISLAPRHEGELPLSRSQKQLWFVEQLNRAQSAYQVPLVFRIVGDLHFDLLNEAFGQLLQRHEILRTSYPDQEGSPFASVVENIDFAVRRVDKRDVEATAQQLTTEALKRPISLTSAPLLHATAYETAENDYTFVIVLHHLIADGWSLVVFLQELSELYTALLF